MPAGVLNGELSPRRRRGRSHAEARHPQAGRRGRGVVAIHLPRLYPILDASRLPAGMSAAAMARELTAGGATWIQHRNKSGSGRELLAEAQSLRAAEPGVTWVMNDRPDLAVAAGFSGVHVGQEDLSPAGARAVCPAPMLVGISTHSVEQVREADQMPVDYIAIGPVFATSSKADPDPVVGLEGVRSARNVTGKPLVAIGGITLANCTEVIAAGADCVAVISELIATPRKTTEAFLRVLG